jgi:hypothetical protein
MGANLYEVLKRGEQGIRSLILLFRNYQKARLDPSPFDSNPRIFPFRKRNPGSPLPPVGGRKADTRI